MGWPFYSTITDIWWPIGPPPARVRRRWLKKWSGSASVSCPVTATVPIPAARSRAAH